MVLRQRRKVCRNTAPGKVWQGLGAHQGDAQAAVASARRCSLSVRLLVLGVCVGSMLRDCVVLSQKSMVVSGIVVGVLIGDQGVAASCSLRRSMLIGRKPRGRGHFRHLVLDAHRVASAR